MKKIVIFTSTGGGGHLAVSDALSAFLSTDYEIKTVLTFTDVIRSLDLIHLATGGRYNWIQLYNDFIQKKYFSTINVLQMIGSHYISLRHDELINIFSDYLISTKADLVISVIPLINRALAQATENLSLPCIIIPTDLDASIAIENIKTIDAHTTYFAYSFDKQEIKNTFAHLYSTKIRTHEVGFPLRASFLLSYNKETIKKKYSIPHNKAIALLLMGYHGSSALSMYVKELAKVPVSLHIIACIGKDTKTGTALASLPLPPHITMSIIGFTDHIAELMSVADLLISKSGSVSVCEALYMNLPLFLDATSKVLAWEQFNHDFIEHNGFGYSIRHKREIVPLVSQFLIHAPTRNAMKTKLSLFQKKNSLHEIGHLIQSIISP